MSLNRFEIPIFPIDNTSDCGSDLETVSPMPISKTSTVYNTSETSSFKSTILAGHVVDSDSSTTNSYQTAQSTSLPEHPASKNDSTHVTMTDIGTLDKTIHLPESKTPESSNKILRRLSLEFAYSPRTFTERLVTIIDESENCTETRNVNESTVNLTRDFRKICKYLQDESMPEWAPSLCQTFNFSKQANSKCPEEKKDENHKNSETILESPELSCTRSYKTPLSKPSTEKKIYRKTPLNIFKKIHQTNVGAVSPGSLNSTKEFEYLEKHFSSPSASPGSQTKDLRISENSSTTPDLSKEDIVFTSEKQLRSLDITNSPTDFETFDSHRGQCGPTGVVELRSLRDRNRAYSTKAEQYLNRSSPEIDEEELSTSLKLEKERQRQRCLQTARLMEQIEEDAKTTNDDYSQVWKRHGINPETAFLKTITTCAAYSNCVTKSDNTKFPLRNSGKQHSRNYEGVAKNPRILGLPTVSRKSRGTINARKRSPTLLCNTAKTMGRRRSNDKLSPARRIPKKINNFHTPERRPERRLKTRDENNIVTSVPHINIVAPTPKFNGKNGKTSSDEQQSNFKCTPQSTPRRAKSPAASVKSSSVIKSASKERQPKIINHQTEKKVGNSGSKISNSPRFNFFTTPGKVAPTKTLNTREKKFFPSMDNDMNKESRRIMRSPHCPGLFRLGYDTVISPVGMYIRGTDVNLIQNVPEEKDEMLLTPNKAPTTEERLKFKLSSKTSTPCDSPRKINRLFVDDEVNIIFIGINGTRKKVPRKNVLEKRFPGEKNLEKGTVEKSPRKKGSLEKKSHEKRSTEKWSLVKKVPEKAVSDDRKIYRGKLNNFLCENASK